MAVSAASASDALAAEWQARLQRNNQGWEQYTNQLQEKLEHERLKLQSDKERLELDKALLATDLAQQVAMLRLRNQEILREIEGMRAAPVRTGARTLLWGLMRAAYRAVPMSPELRSHVSSRVVPRIVRLAPHHRPAQLAMDVHMPQPAGEAVAPTLEFPVVEHPDISVIVPVYNQVSYTIACLSSLTKQISPYTFEVIVMDDCSTDRTEELLSAVPGLRYVRNEENLGFIGNCNKGAELASGRHVVFLNNDTFALPGWLAALRSTFNEHGNVGVVGSKLVYGDGTLQEAGGIIWQDGSGWNWGRLKDPAHPKYNYVRDVDYVSGAALMIERALFLETGGFDTELEKAYYEDTAKCFQIREMGLRVLCPSSGFLGQQAA